MRTRLVLSALVAVVMGGEACADGVSYSYLQGNAVLGQLSQHGSVMNGSGLGLEAAGAVGPYLFGFGSLNSVLYSAKFYDVNTSTHIKYKLTPAALGVGGHFPLFSSLDVLGGVSLERLKLAREETSQPTGRWTFNGWGGTLGLRGWFSDVIQWDILARYSKVEDLQTVLGYTFSARYYFKAAYSFGVDINGRLYDDRDNTLLNVNESVVSVLFRHDFGVHY